jgi:hypothetical protein
MGKNKWAIPDKYLTQEFAEAVGRYSSSLVRARAAWHSLAKMTESHPRKRTLVTDTRAALLDAEVAINEGMVAAMTKAGAPPGEIMFGLNDVREDFAGEKRSIEASLSALD